MKISAGGLINTLSPVGSAWLKAETLLLLGILVLGFSLRLWAATGDLWFDEIWTVKSVQELGGVDEIFTQWISDNNHPLNSLYVFWAKDQADAVWIRALSIAVGTGSIFAAYWAAAAQGARVRVLFAFQIAVAFPFVLYGSEARGFAGMSLCAIIAMGIVERHLRTDKNSPYAIALAGCVAVGTLFHMTFLLLAFALGLWALVTRLRQEDWHFGKSVARVYQFFRPAILTVLVFAGLLYALLLFNPTTTVEVGSITHFEWRHVVDGYDGLLRYFFGVEQTPPFIIQGLLAGALIAGLRHTKRVPSTAPDLTVLAAISLGIIPLILVIAHLPNLQYPRYYLGLLVALCYWLSIIIARASRANGFKRIISGALSIAFIVGQISQFAEFSTTKRGQYRLAIEEILNAGGTLYSSAEPHRTVVTVDYFLTTHFPDVSLAHRSLEEIDCAAAPQWYIAEILTPLEDLQQHATLRAQDCAVVFDLHKVFQDHGLSGVSWALYRRASQN